MGGFVVENEELAQLIRELMETPEGQTQYYTRTERTPDDGVLVQLLAVAPDDGVHVYTVDWQGAVFIAYSLCRRAQQARMLSGDEDYAKTVNDYWETLIQREIEHARQMKDGNNA